MAAKYVVLALAAICIAKASAASHIRRSTDASLSVENLLESARTQLTQLTSGVSNWANGPSFEEVKAMFENKTHELESRAKSVLEEAKRQMETHGSELSEKANQALQEATTQFNDAIQKLKESAPGVMSQASEVTTNFENSFKAAVDVILQESGKLAKAAGDDVGSAHDELAALSRSAVTKTLEVLQQFHNEVNAAVTRATSS